MRGRRQRRPLYGRPLLHPVVPEYYLPRVGASQDQIRVELGELRRHYRALAVENVFGRGLLELGVPDERHAVGIVGRLFVIVVGGQEKLGVVGGPVQGSEAAVLRPSLVEEPAVEGDALVRFFVSKETTKC